MNNKTNKNPIDTNEIESFVESWLKQNNQWFLSYAIENLDLCTVEKWLRINDKKICKCKSSPGSINSSLLSVKRNSIASFNNCSNSILKDDKIELTKKCFSKLSTNLNLNSSKENFLRPDTLTNGIYRSSSYNCIQNGKLIHVNNFKKELLDSNANIFSCNDDNMRLLTANVGKQKQNVNRLCLDLPKSILISSLEASKPASRKTSIETSSLETLASNLLLTKRNSFLRKYHSFYSYDSVQSSNLLKLLIKSKIKIPTCFSTITNADKQKLRKAKNNDFEFLLELIKDTLNELNLRLLNEKIINNLKVLVNAEKASLFFVCKNRKRLASFKLDPYSGINDESNSFDPSINDFELQFPFDSTLIGSVAQTGNIVNIPNKVNNFKSFSRPIKIIKRVIIVS